MCDLLKAVNRYLVREFDEDAKLKKIPEDGILHLAYTTYEFGDDEEHEIQVDFDLLNQLHLKNNIVIDISVGATTLAPMSPQLPQILIHAGIVLEIALTDKLLAHEFIKGY